MEGWLEKRGRRFNTSYQRRYFRTVADEDGSVYLLWYRKQVNDARPRGSVLLVEASGASPVKTAREGHRELRLEAPGRVLELRAPAAETREAWVAYFEGLRGAAAGGGEAAVRDRRASVLDPGAIATAHEPYHDGTNAEDEPLPGQAGDGFDAAGYGFYGSYDGFDPDGYAGDGDVEDAAGDAVGRGMPEYEAAAAAAGVDVDEAARAMDGARGAERVREAMEQRQREAEAAAGRERALAAFMAERALAAQGATTVEAAAGGGDWNARWVALHSHEARTLDDTVAYGGALRRLQDEFSAEVERTARVIVAEARLPVEERTLRPADDLGGVAGGVKVVHNGVLYKFALDDKGLYGGDEFAMKAASNELRSLDQIYNARAVHPFVTPLTATVDWLGFRLTAATLVPISGETIVYGSADGGRTVVSRHELAEAGAEALGRTLNLKPHACGPAAGVTMHGPADIEVHAGRDGGRLYILDAARLFPPEAPLPGVHNAWLYRLLRPEAVRASKVPLSSDAFSRFGRDGAARHNAEVRRATEETFGPRLAALAASLDAREAGALARLPLGREMHEAGLGCRHAGLLRHRMRGAAARRALLNDMVARALKSEFRTAMRRVVQDARGASAEDFDAAVRRKAAACLEVFFGASAATARYWSGRLRRVLLARYLGGLDAAEAAEGRDLRDFCDVPRVRELLLDAARVRLADGAAAPYEAAHVTEVGARVRSLGAVPLAEAQALVNAALKAPDAEGAKRMRALALARFEEAARATPNSRAVLLAFAAFLQMHAGDVQRAGAMLERAAELFPADADVLGNVATFHMTVSRRLDRAEHFYRLAVEADPEHLENVCNRAVFLVQVLRQPGHPWLRQLREAGGVSARERNPRAVGNLGLLRWHVLGDLDGAERCFELSVDRNAGDASCLCNYAAFLWQARGRPAEAAEMYEAALANAPTNAFAKVYLGQLRATSLGDVEGGLALQREAVRENPENDNARLSLAQTLVTAGRLDEAVRELEAMLERRPNEDAALEQLGDVYKQMGRVADARRAYERRVAASPHQPWAHMNLAMAVNAAEGPAAANAHYQRAMQALQDRTSAGVPPDGELVYNYANHQARTGQVAAALANYRVAAATGKPAGGLAEINAASIMMQQGAAADALVMLAPVLAEGGSDPGGLRALNVAVQAAAATQGPAAAFELLDRAIERTGRAAPAPLFLRGKLLAQMQQHAPAAEVLEEAVALEQRPGEEQLLPGALGDLGLCYGMLSAQAPPAQAAALRDRAIDALRRAVAAPGAPPAFDRFNLACLLLKRGAGDAAEARRLLEEAKQMGALPPPQHLAQDDDLASVRGEAWFQALLR